MPVCATAQRPVTVGVAGGFTATTGTARTYAYETGAHAQFSPERARFLGRLGVRGDAFVHGFTRPTYGGNRSVRTSIPGASASFMLPFAAVGAVLQPYLLTGAGTYRTDLGGGSPEWHFGLSGGGGITMGHGRVHPFVEVRLHQVYDGATPRLIPVAIGGRF